jgi:hypothetical protein
MENVSAMLSPCGVRFLQTSYPSPNCNRSSMLIPTSRGTKMLPEEP